jgi:hypothetical protein
MIFLSSLIISIGLVFTSSLINLIKLFNEDYLRLKNLYYNLLPIDLVHYREIYIAASFVIVIVTAFFLIPVFLLLLIQIKNFLANRTTNERYSRKKPL